MGIVPLISVMFPHNANVHSRVTGHRHINVVCPHHNCENNGG